VTAARRRTLLVAALVFAGLGTGTPAFADHLDLDATFPQNVAVGDVLEVSVVVRSAESGARIPGARVAAYREASIAGVPGRVELAAAVTDELGAATLHWQHRAGGEHTLLVTYAGPGDTAFESTTITIITIGAEPQVVRAEAGVRIPGLGAWVLISVLVAVWGLIQFSLLGPMTVAREGGRTESSEPSTGGSGTT
jgi:hypothetical protein